MCVCVRVDALGVTESNRLHGGVEAFGSGLGDPRATRKTQSEATKFQPRFWV